ncbi:hypothetical protein HRbin40_00223 [bacterium HR40]|nr:hypothetical protein HRbin40_00223 [bacterium HR40]
MRPWKSGLCSRLPETADFQNFRFLDGVTDIAPELWDALRPEPDPFTSHAFLAILEESGSVGGKTGWQPLHLLCGDPARPSGVVPLYAKGHSFGEYVFDQGWAEAYTRAGGRYYPKLQAAVPFTPVPGPRLLAVDEESRKHLIGGLEDALSALGPSSVHVTFCTAEETVWLRERGWLVRRGIQFHWHNRGYQSFDDFLAALLSSRRKTIRRERREVREAGIDIRIRNGDELAPEEVEAFYPFYLATVEKRQGGAYLTRRFFRLLGERLGSRLVLVEARRDGATVAAALHLRGGDTLYGRWWGAIDDFRFLHFECCYYRAIEFAIANRLARVEAGAQGMHKLLRGYEPVWTWSAHKFRDPKLSAGVAAFVAREGMRLEREFAELRSLLPYAREAGRTG